MTTIIFIALAVQILGLFGKVKRHCIDSNMARGGALKELLDEYAASNGGDYPPNLAALAASWPGAAKLKYDPVGRGAMRDWLYYPGLTTDSSAGEIILAGAEHFGPGSPRQRIVIRLDGEPEVLDETDFRIQTIAITNAEEQFHHAYRFFKGQQVPQDEVIAMKWLHRSADQGYAKAQMELGGCYLVGKYVRKDEAEAARLYRLAAEQRYAEGQFNLGLSYLAGKGVPRDPAAAAEWFRKAAVQGLAPAQMSLGVAYAKGEGISQDFAKAGKWTRLSAEQGYAPAEFNLGVSYMRGEGIPKDTQAGIKWCRKAADQSYALAMFNLGHFHAEGIGTSRDDVAAYMWFELATKSMNSEFVPAASARDQLATRMNADQIKRARRLARNWREAR